MTMRNAMRMRVGLLLAAVCALALATGGCSWFGKDKRKEPIHIEDLGALSPSDIPPPVTLSGGASPTGLGPESTSPDDLTPPVSPPEQHSGLSIPAVEPVRAEPTMVVSELQTIHFPYDSSRILPEQMAKLQQNAQWILQHPGITIQIEGHCDERGSVEYNINLGQRRADAVREELYRMGVDPAMLTTISYGEERPIDPGHTEEAWAKNRRVQFLMY